MDPGTVTLSSLQSEAHLFEDAPRANVSLDDEGLNSVEPQGLEPVLAGQLERPRSIPSAPMRPAEPETDLRRALCAGPIHQPNLAYYLGRFACDDCERYSVPPVLVLEHTSDELTARLLAYAQRKVSGCSPVPQDAMERFGICQSKRT